MISILKDELEDASPDQSIRVIVLAAKGNVFASAQDLKENNFC
jgi:Enoyl-CoA hydratase/carnithine racemase